MRAIAADYIQSHGDDFLPFLGSEDTLETYCRSVRETATWGGEPEIVALSRAFNVPIYVVQGTEPPMIMQFFPNRVANSNDPIVWISYHKRLYGLGEVSFKQSVSVPQTDDICHSTIILCVPSGQHDFPPGDIRDKEVIDSCNQNSEGQNKRSSRSFLPLLSEAPIGRGSSAK